MIFDSESVFEENVITVLKQHGWKDGVLRYPTGAGFARQLERHTVPQQQRHRQAWQIPADGRGNDPDNRADRDPANAARAQFVRQRAYRVYHA